jgi:hypothetical protein
MTRLLMIMVAWFLHTVILALTSLACFMLIARVGFTLFLVAMAVISGLFIQLLLNALPEPKNNVDGR